MKQLIVQIDKNYDIVKDWKWFCLPKRRRHKARMAMKRVIMRV